jgi:hypothetical protein
VRCHVKLAVCPFCDVVSGVPHHSQQACIDALQEEIAQTRAVLQRRTCALIAHSVGAHFGSHRLSARADVHVKSVRLSLRSTIER